MTIGFGGPVLWNPNEGGWVVPPDNFALKFVVNNLNCLKSIHSLIHSANKVIEYKVCIWHSSSIWGLLDSRYRSRNPTIYTYTSSPWVISLGTYWCPCLPIPHWVWSGWPLTCCTISNQTLIFFPMCSYIFCNNSIIISIETCIVLFSMFRTFLPCSANQGKLLMWIYFPFQVKTLGFSSAWYLWRDRAAQHLTCKMLMRLDLCHMVGPQLHMVSSLL